MGQQFVNGHVLTEVKKKKKKSLLTGNREPRLKVRDPLLDFNIPQIEEHAGGVQVIGY